MKVRIGAAQMKIRSLRGKEENLQAAKLLTKRADEEECDHEFHILSDCICGGLFLASDRSAICHLSMPHTIERNCILLLVYHINNSVIAYP